jgi:6-phospho-beta-glucosidase
MKLSVVGGGSTYTPELADGIARLGLPVDELALIDPDSRRLGLVSGVSSRIMAAYGHKARVRAVTGLDEGLDGADAVILQLRIGGQAARQRDETWPLECGCVGQETTGAGGLAKALRTVPVVLDIAERVRERAGSAWIIDFTNPVGIVTRALLDAGHRAVGLCNVAIGFQRRFAAMLRVEPGRITLGHVGLNHLTWERTVRVDGADRLPELLGGHADDIAAAAGLPADLIRHLGAVPSYYLRYYYAHDLVVDEQRGSQTQPGQTRAAQVSAIERELLDMYADPSLDRKPELLSKRGGAYYSEAAVALIAALSAGTGDVQVVNVRNNGTLPFLAAEAVIEVPARIEADGPVPVAAGLDGPVGPAMAGLIAHVSAYEELAVDAAVRGGRDRVFAALLAHPLIGQATTAGWLADRLIAENRGYLEWAARTAAG